MINKKELYNLYWNKSLSTIQIGKRCGLTRNRVLYLMIKFSIPRRTLKEAHKKFLIPKKELFKLYWEDKLTQEQIGKRYGLQRYHIHYLMEQFSIPRRNPSKAHQKLFISKQKLHNLYWDKGLSTIKIAKKYNVNEVTIFKRMCDYKIPRRNNSENMKNNNPMSNPLTRKKHLKKVRTQKFRNKARETFKSNWKNPKIREKNLKNLLKAMFQRPTSLEKEFIKIIKRYNLPFKYVGDGEIIIGYKNPDFISTNGNKLIIETANRFHHKENYPEIRQKIFGKYGYQVLVLWAKKNKNELEDNEKEIIEKVKNLINSK